MRLSDAIREGCRYSTKTTRQFFGTTPHSACALGAAIIGYNRRTGDEITMLDLARVWPELNQETEFIMRATCPDCGTYADLRHVITTHLNDGHRWTREAIADFIDTLSLDLTPAPVVRERVPA